MCVEAGRAEQALAVRAHEVTEARRDVGQGAVLIAIFEQELDRAEHPRCEHDAFGAQAWAGATEQRGRVLGFDLIPAVVRDDAGDLQLRQHFRAPLLGEIEVILVERVLRAEPAADHAPAAQVATGSLGTGAGKVGIGHRDVGFAEVHAHFRGVEGVGAAHAFAHALERAFAFH